MGVSIDQWRMRIGCHGSQSNSKHIHPSQQSLLTPSSSTRSRQAPGWTALLLILTLLTPHLSLQLVTTNSSLLPHLQASSYQQTLSIRQNNISVTGYNSPSTSGQLSWSRQYTTSKQRNRLVRAVNGNRDSRGIKLAHWNAGSAHLHNKMTELELAVADHQPHLLGISEANFKSVHDLEEVQLEDYELFLSKTIDNPELGISRVVCYKHSSLVGSMREDLMSYHF